MVRAIIGVQVPGSYFVSPAALAVMEKQGHGRMVFTRRRAARGGDPFATAYGAAEAGVIGFVEAVALAGEPLGFRANVNSRYANTGMGRAMETKGADERLHDHTDMIGPLVYRRHASATVV